MASGIVILADQGGGATKEGVGTGGDDDTFSFTLLASGTPEWKSALE
jgi:hypothetical protein